MNSLPFNFGQRADCKQGCPVRAQTKTYFAAIKLFETKKENKFQQKKEGTKVNKTTVTRISKQLGSRQRRSSIAGRQIFLQIVDQYLADHQDLWRITILFGGLP